MLKNRLRDLAKDSSIYGLAKVGGQAIGFFLIPLYTHYLTPEDYGILNILGTVSVSLGIFITFGLDAATYRFVGLAQTNEDAAAYLGTARWLNIVGVFIFTVSALTAIRPLTRLLLTAQAPSIFLLIIIGTSVCGSISSISRSYLRIKRRAKSIALASVINVLVSLTTVFLLVVVFQKGVIGALLGNLVGAMASSITIFILSRDSAERKVHYSLVPDLIRYAGVVLPAKLLVLVIPLYSQWSVKTLLNLDELGLYAIALKFTMPLTLGLTMFQQAYAPYKFEILKSDEDPSNTFSNIMNIWLSFFGVAVIVISFLGPIGIRLLTPSIFHNGANYIFTIALIPLAQGFYFMCSAGQELSKSPIWRPVISLIGLTTFLLINRRMIECYEINGAAMSIVISWMIMAKCNLIYSYIIYPINYQWSKIMFIFLGILSYGIYTQFKDPTILGHFIFTLALSIVFLYGSKKVLINSIK